MELMGEVGEIRFGQTLFKFDEVLKLAEILLFGSLLFDVSHVP